MKKIVCVLLLIANLAFAQDQKAFELQDQAVKAMGGRKNYDKTPIIKWTFFGIRTLTWDKKNNKVRIDYLKENSSMIVNLNDLTGMVKKNGRIIRNTDTLKIMLQEAKNTWINDSYWLVMPFKLQDPGVNIKYIGKEKTAENKEAEVIELTFNAVGVTPDNKYHIFFDPDTKLVSQWSFFTKATDPKPRFTMPWKEYKPYGKILLSGSRGERRLDNIEVLKKTDIFNSL